MIQTAVERGMKGEANKYLKRMTDRGLSWKAETCGALLSAQAKVKDWESLQKTLTIMDGQGFAIPRGSFNVVLNAYAEAKVYIDTDILQVWAREGHHSGQAHVQHHNQSFSLCQ
ncbi:hypothetical protein L211DRAFT_590574 [Terfezia boudieri ATCC MYA-4762]|uniref:Pentacotripeptide-repeat region of PRORP domain-containing protein n=1 Tax=Terfezia boudieri ATCC MYA-4762 TaxID=1051890 RepID=A0A3N4LA14_9PEZI|nr:hypothetical protein L211DRAFT_590574 [Terfezia boudieri ATCC MYA-4762]